jgi:hypothetical protein
LEDDPALFEGQRWCDGESVADGSPSTAAANVEEPADASVEDPAPAAAANVEEPADANVEETANANIEDPAKAPGSHHLWQRLVLLLVATVVFLLALVMYLSLRKPKVIIVTAPKVSNDDIVLGREVKQSSNAEREDRELLDSAKATGCV